MSEKLLPGLLVHRDFSLRDKEFVFDLDLEVSASEMDLIQKLARQNSVHLFVPEAAAQDSLSAYHLVVDFAQGKQDAPVGFDDISFLKLPTMLSEVKEAVAHVRQCIEQGCEPSSVIVASPDIEKYWPTLSEYLSVEGIPVNKPTVAPLSQNTTVQKWLSALKIAVDRFHTADPMQVLFLSGETSEISYDDYKKQFDLFFARDDFQRRPKIFAELPTDADGQKRLNFRDFIQWAMNYWPSGSAESLELWASSWDSLWFLPETLSVEKWIEFLELFIARREYKLREADEQGVHIVSLESLSVLESEAVILLGMSQSSMQTSATTPVPLSDVLSIKSLYGLYLDHSERNKRILSLEWGTAGRRGTALATFGETDFFGTFQTPSLFWLKGAMEKDAMDLQEPQLSRWDQLMKQPLSEMFGFPADERHCSQQKMQAEKNQSQQVLVEMAPFYLSATSLEDYFKCPFRILVKKGFHLRDSPSLEMDVDYSARGTLLHKICEIVLRQKRFSVDPAEVRALVDEAREEQNIDIVDASFWPVLRKFYENFTRDFILFEKQWRLDYPQTTTVYFEQALKGFLSLKAENLFVTEDDGGAFPFRGSVDRIDQSADRQSVVIDYKTSGGGLFQYGSWLKKGLLQNVLYALALGEGLGPEDAKDVRGAFYYILRDLKRGLGLASVSSDDFLPAAKKNAPSFESLVGEGRELVRDLLKQMHQGNFSTEPADPKVCQSCSWDHLCRRSRAHL